jgi:hypothetical protein
MKSQKIASYIIYPKEAHMSEQTDQTNPGTDILEKETHQAVYQRRSMARAREVGPADPWGQLNLDRHLSSAFWWEARSYPPEGGLTCFHIWRWQEPTATKYKRGLSSHTPHTQLGSLSLTLPCDLYSLG